MEYGSPTIISPNFPVIASNILLPKNLDKLFETSDDKSDVFDGLHDSKVKVGTYSTVVTTSTLNVSDVLIPVNKAYIGDLVQYVVNSASTSPLATLVADKLPLLNI